MLLDLLGEPYPGVYIQRKPHPNGLLLYLLSCCVDHHAREKGLPFVLDFLPHLVVNDTAPDDTLVQFRERWACSSPFPDSLGDAAFGSEPMIKRLKSENVNSLFSVPTDASPYVWETLSAGNNFYLFYVIDINSGLTPNTWRGAINEQEGITASVHMRQDTQSRKVTYHHVMSTIHTGTISTKSLLI